MTDEQVNSQIDLHQVYQKVEGATLPFECGCGFVLTSMGMDCEKNHLCSQVKTWILKDNKELVQFRLIGYCDECKLYVVSPIDVWDVNYNWATFNDDGECMAHGQLKIGEMET